MNNKTTNWILLFFLIISLGAMYTFFNYNKELELQIQKRDKTIQEINKVDSVLIEKTKDYAKQIEEFKTQPSFIFKGKEITASEIVDLLNIAYEKIDDLEIDNQSLKYRDSVNKINLNTVNYNIEVYKKALKKAEESNYEYSKSNYILNSKLKTIKQNYGIDLKIRKIDSLTIGFDKPMLMIDSAIILYPYYKNRLKIENGTWIISIDEDYEKLRNKKLKEIKKNN